MACVNVEEVETGDQSAEAQQSKGMLTFKRTSSLKEAGEWGSVIIAHT